MPWRSSTRPAAKRSKVLDELYIYPAKHFVTPEERIKAAIDGIEQESNQRLAKFREKAKCSKPNG